GEIPESVATDIILEAANADAALKDLLLQLGLLEEEDGEIRVNFPNADKTIGAINRMTQSILLLQAAGDKDMALQLAIDLYGKEEALEVFGLVENADGTYSKMTVETESTGAAEALADIREVELADGTVVTVKAGVDTSDWENLTAAELAALDGNDPVELPVEGVLQPMAGVSDEEWNAMLGPFPEIEIPATVNVQAGSAAVGD